MRGSRTTHCRTKSTSGSSRTGKRTRQAKRPLCSNKPMKMFRLAFLLALLALTPPVFVSGQIPYSGQYNRGQDVVPVYEGWMPNPDGTYTMYFGYFNRNY